MHIDEECGKVSLINFPVLMIMIGVALISIFSSIKVVLYKGVSIDSAICVLVITVLVIVLYNILVKIYYGRKMIFQLKLNIPELIIYTMLLQNKVFSFQDIYSVSLYEPDWFMKRFKLDKGNASGLTIYLKDGRYFRVSPHMERINELRATLEEMIERNKKLEDEK